MSMVTLLPLFRLHSTFIHWIEYFRLRAVLTVLVAAAEDRCSISRHRVRTRTDGKSHFYFHIILACLKRFDSANVATNGEEW